MKGLYALLIGFFWSSVFLYSQENAVPSSPKKGYDYFKSRIKIGYTLGQYTYHHSGSDIYMYRINNGFTSQASTKRIYSVDDQFSPMNFFRGIHIGGELGDENLRVEIYFTTRKSTSDAKYSYDNGVGTPIIQEHEKVRVRYNALTWGVGYRFEKLPMLTLGACLDIGILRTQIKLGSQDDNKWYPWFYSFKIFGSGVKPNTPVATWGLYASFDLGPISFRLNRNFTLLDGDLNSQTFKYTNIPWSSKVFPMANTSLSASIKF
jgi:hypothetical protein